MIKNNDHDNDDKNNAQNEDKKYVQVQSFFE